MSSHRNGTGNGTMTRNGFLGKALTQDYRPRVVGGMLALDPDHRGLFSLNDIERMRRDPQIDFGLRILYAPMPSVKWEVKAASKEIAGFIDATLKKVWSQHLRQLLECLPYGRSGGELLYREDPETGRIEFDRLAPVHPLDLRPLTQDRELVGVSVQGVAHGNSGSISGRGNWLLMPRSLWIANEAEHGRFWGKSRLMQAWYPWKEKIGRHGAIDVRRLWYVKNAYRGGIMYHPSGTIQTAAGVYQTCQDYAREIIEKAETGGVLTLPSITDEKGNPLWRYEPPAINGEAAGIRDYAKDLDMEILVALGIPPEVVNAAASGSGWSGRSVPFLVYLTGEDLIAQQILTALDQQLIRPLVEVNFGKQATHQYQVTPISLVTSEMKEDATKGGQPGQGGQQQGGQEQQQGGGLEQLLAGLQGGEGSQDGQQQEQMSLVGAEPPDWLSGSGYAVGRPFRGRSGRWLARRYINGRVRVVPSRDPFQMPGGGGGQAIVRQEVTEQAQREAAMLGDALADGARAARMVLAMDASEAKSMMARLQERMGPERAGKALRAAREVLALAKGA
ncbi:MAG: hypothetical protein E6Q97_10180 [Desulfurellales bacterium]|nr:MAG: hypothetical protein E6Q97_10180 [Desulfurellales bacterium]